MVIEKFWKVKGFSVSKRISITIIQKKRRNKRKSNFEKKLFKENLFAKNWINKNLKKNKFLKY